MSGGPELAPAGVARPESGPTKSGGRRLDTARRYDVSLLLLSIATVPILVYLGRSLTFWQDEWTFLGSDPSGPLALLAPHNEHWSTVPRLVYGLLLAVGGLRSYLPYLTLLATLHVLAIGGVYVLLVGRLVRPVAFVLVLPLFFLGAGYENLLWAFQIGFVSSVAAGTWALAFLESNRPRAALFGSLLLVVAMASSGIGLVMFAVAFVRLLADRGPRPRFIWLLLPAAIYALWFAGFGLSGRSAGAGFAEAPAILRFVGRGVVNAAATFVGLDLAGSGAGRALAAGLIGLAAVAIGWIAWTRRAVPPLAIASFGGLVGMFVLIGSVRADLASDFAERSRYVYVAAFLIVLLAGDLIAETTSVVSLHRVVKVGLTGLVLISVVANVRDLRSGQTVFRAHADVTRGYLTVLEASRNATWLDPAGTLPGMPPVPDLLRLLSVDGWPTADGLVPSVVRPPSQAALDGALVLLAGRGFRVDASPPIGGQPVAVTVLGVADARLLWSNGCASIEPGGDRPAVTLEVPSGGAATLTGPTEQVSATFGRNAPPSSRGRITFRLRDGTPAAVHVPDLGDGLSWRVTIALPARSATAIACVLRP